VIRAEAWFDNGYERAATQSYGMAFFGPHPHISPVSRIVPSFPPFVSPVGKSDLEPPVSHIGVRLGAWFSYVVLPKNQEPEPDSRPGESDSFWVRALALPWSASGFCRARVRPQNAG